MEIRPDRQIVWNEFVHSFEPIGFNRFVHYERPIAIKRGIIGKAVASNTTDDRPCDHEKECAPRFLSGVEVEQWINARRKPALTSDDVSAWKDLWSTGKFGPMDNPHTKFPDPED